MTNSKMATFVQDWNAQDYKKYAIPQYEIALDALSKWKFNGNENVLDIGCGNGSITFVVAKKYVPNGFITGIDLSKDMISHALTEYKADNLNFENIDASNISFKNKYDLITSFYCIHWIKDKQKVINGIANSLKQNGKILLYLMYDGSKLKNLLSKIVHGIVDSTKWSKYFPNYRIPLHLPNLNSFKMALQNAKLKIISFENIDKELFFENKEALIHWINALPFVNHIPSDIRPEILYDIVEIYMKSNNIKSNEPIKFFLPTLIVSAQK